jgi:hypothetical protein
MKRSINHYQKNKSRGQNLERKINTKCLQWRRRGRKSIQSQEELKTFDIQQSALFRTISGRKNLYNIYQNYKIENNEKRNQSFIFDQSNKKFCMN